MSTFSNLHNTYRNLVKDLKARPKDTNNSAVRNLNLYYDTSIKSPSELFMCNKLNDPFIVSDNLVVYSLNPYKSKRIYKKHRLCKSLLPFAIYTCEIVDNNYIVKLERGIQFSGDTLYDDLKNLIVGFDFPNIHSFFGLTERKVQAAFYTNHN